MLGVAVKFQRFALEEFAQAALGSLTPQRIHFWIHIRVEPIHARDGEALSCGWLLFDEADPCNRFDAFEPVLPGRYQADRRAILIRQNLAVQTEAEKDRGCNASSIRSPSRYGNGMPASRACGICFGS